MHGVSVTVSRFGVYPALPEDPIGYVVGFLVTHLGSARTLYRDCIVPFSDAADEDAAVANAWETLKEGVEAWNDACSAKSPLVGSTFVPPAADPDPTPAPEEPSADPAPAPAPEEPATDPAPIPAPEES